VSDQGGKMIQGNVNHGESQYERTLSCCKIAGGIVEIWKIVSVLICMAAVSLSIRQFVFGEKAS
jgi:hypothetical protein